MYIYRFTPSTADSKGDHPNANENIVHPKDQMSTLSSTTIPVGVCVSSGARKGAEDLVAASSSTASACCISWQTNYIKCYNFEKNTNSYYIPFYFEYHSALW